MNCQFGLLTDSDGSGTTNGEACLMDGSDLQFVSSDDIGPACAHTGCYKIARGVANEHIQSYILSITKGPLTFKLLQNAVRKGLDFVIIEV